MRLSGKDTTTLSRQSRNMEQSPSRCTWFIRACLPLQGGCCRWCPNRDNTHGGLGVSASIIIRPHSTLAQPVSVSVYDALCLALSASLTIFTNGPTAQQLAPALHLCSSLSIMQYVWVHTRLLSFSMSVACTQQQCRQQQTWETALLPSEPGFLFISPHSWGLLLHHSPGLAFAS